MNWALLAVMSGAADGGAAIGATFGPLRDKVHRQTYCVVRCYNRPEGREVLFESRLPKPSRRFLEANQDGTLTIMFRSDVDAYNAAAMNKRAWWTDFHAMMDATVRVSSHDFPKDEPEPVENSDRFDSIEQTQTLILKRLDAMTGEESPTKWSLPTSYDDDEMRRLQEKFRETVSGRHMLLTENSGAPAVVMPGESVAVTSAMVLGDEPSVMSEMAPTEAIDAAALKRSIEQIASVAYPYHYMADPIPTEARGIGKVPNATRTVSIPLGNATLPKPAGGPVGGEQ